MTASNIMSRLAGNLQFQNEAKNRAENALFAGESFLNTTTASWTQNNYNSINTTNPTSDLPIYPPASAVTPLSNWPAAAFTVDSTGSGFYIQLISSTPSTASGESLAMGTEQTRPGSQCYLFRVTARGTSVRGASRFVESIYQVPAPAQ